MKYVLWGSVLVLLACTAATSIAPPKNFVDVPSLDVRFAYPETPRVHAQESDVLMVTSTVTIHAQTLSYKDTAVRQDDEVFEWVLPKDVADAVRDERACTKLRDPSVFLPVDTTAAFHCDIVLDTSGRVIVWMVGLGRPFQNVTYIQSSMIVLEEDHYRLFEDMYAFPEADATVEWLTDTFDSRHPHMSSLIWPNKSFMIHIKEVHEALLNILQPMSAEVQDAMLHLQGIAFSVERSTEVSP